MTTLFQKEKIPLQDLQLKVLVRNLEMIKAYNAVKMRFVKPAKYDKNNSVHEKKLHEVSHEPNFFELIPDNFIAVVHIETK